MKLLVFALVVLALLAIWRFRSLPKPGQEDQVTLDQVEAVYESLHRTGSDGSFAIFLPASSTGAPDIQLSIQQGRVGLDWVLENAANIRGKEAFENLLDSAEASYKELEMNGVRYVRTEDRRAPELCRRVLQEIFEVDAGAPMALIVESFEWSPKQ